MPTDPEIAKNHLSMAASEFKEAAFNLRCALKHMEDDGKSLEVPFAKAALSMAEAWADYFGGRAQRLGGPK